MKNRGVETGGEGWDWTFDSLLGFDVVVLFYGSTLPTTHEENISHESPINLHSGFQRLHLRHIIFCTKSARSRLHGCRTYRPQTLLRAELARSRISSTKYQRFHQRW